MTKRSYIPPRQGFTLVELMVVIAIMAILAAAGATGIVHMVPAYQTRACEEERTQAVRAFVSDWLETRQLAGDDGETLNTVAEKWLSSYLKETQVNCSGAADNWEIRLEKDSSGGGYTATLTCKKHGGADAAAHVGQKDDAAGGIGWDGGFVPPAAENP